MTDDLKERLRPPGRSVISKCADVDGADLSNVPMTYERIWLQSDDGDGVTWCQHSQDDEDVPYVRADFYAASLARITDLETRLAASEDKLYDAQSGPWPQWAASILACLKDFGWRFDDLIDLPDELGNYLRDYPDSAVTGLQEQVGSLSIALAAAEADRDQGKRDYCDLMDRHDAHFVSWQSAKARAEKAEAEVDRLKYLLDGDECPDPDKIDALFSRAEAAEAGEDALAEALLRLSELTPEVANARTARDMYLTVRAISADALAAYEARRG